MTPWVLLTVLVAAINWAGLLVIRGRWGRTALALLLAAVVGTAGGEVIGAAAGVDAVRIGDFHLLAASIGAQLAMLVVLLGAHALPEAGDPRGGR